MPEISRHDIATSVRGMGSGVAAIEGDSLVALKPLNSPWKWKLLAGLAKIPVLCSLSLVQKARAEVETFSKEYCKQREASKQFLIGFKAVLQQGYGHEIADMCLRNITLAADGTPQTPVSVRTVTAALDKAEAKFALQSQSNRTITKFLDTIGSSSGKERTMDDLFVAQGVAEALPEDFRDIENHWSALVHTHAERRFLVDYIESQCREFPEYSQGKLSNALVAKAADNAISSMRQIRSIPGISEDQVSKIYQQVSRLGKEAVDLLNKARSIQNISADRMLEIYFDAVRLESPERRGLAAEGIIIKSGGDIAITL